MDAKTVGKRITELRKIRNMTQQQLADKLAVTNKAVSKWETGEGYPDITTLPDLAAALGVRIDNLLMGRETQKKDVTKAIAIQTIALILIAFVVLFAEEILPRYLDLASLLFVLATGTAATLVILKCRKRIAADFIEHMVGFGLPIAGLSGAVCSAVFYIYEIVNMRDARFSLVIIPLLYACALALGCSAIRCLWKRRRATEKKHH